VKFGELKHALSETIRQGDIGIPVALRVNCQFGDRSHEVIDGALIASQLAETAFSEVAPARLHARITSDNRQLTLLASYALGQTLLLTTTAVDGARSEVDLLVVGNHGIIRLEGSEFFEPDGTPSPSTDIATRWKAAIERSLSSQQAVDMPA
jgi:hypothetical protein